MAKASWSKFHLGVHAERANPLQYRNSGAQGQGMNVMRTHENKKTIRFWMTWRLGVRPRR